MEEWYFIYSDVQNTYSNKFLRCAYRWAQAHELLVEQKMTKDTIREMVCQANIAFRYMCNTVLINEYSCYVHI